MSRDALKHKEKKTMIKKPKQCEYCGRTFTPSKSVHKYCSDRCRKRAHRERQQEERKEQIKAYREKAPQPPRKIYDTDGISATDPRSRLMKMRAHGLLTPEYWALYAEVDKKFNGGQGVVNGVPTAAPNFVEVVLIQTDIEKKIICWTQGRAKHGTDK